MTDESTAINAHVFMDTRPGMAECDFDANPTLLFSLIHQKLWSKVNERVQTHRDECSTWATRRDSSGKIRWRLLPLHAAIIFKAPSETILLILLASPISAQCRDDQGMLPIHLAFRNSHDEFIVNSLLMSYPNCVNIPDKKGRLPSALAELCNEDLKSIYLNALRNVPHYVAIATASLVCNVPSESSNEGDFLSSEQLAVEIHKLRQEKAELEQEYSKTQEASKVLASHVSSLEAQLLTRADTERFLATKISNLDSELREISRNKEIAEASLKVNMNDFEKENIELKSECASLHEKIRDLEAKQKDMAESLNNNLKAPDNDKLKQRCKVLEEACENFEAQLKAKNLTEQALASQVSNLLERLADTTASSAEAESSYLARISQLSSEKAQLKKTVIGLAGKIRSTSANLASMGHKVRVLDSFDGLFAKAKEMHQRIMSDTARNEQILIDAAREREQLVHILTRQAEEIEKTKAERERVIAAIREFHETTAMPIDLKDQAEKMVKNVEDVLHATQEFIDSQFSDGDYNQLASNLLAEEESPVADNANTQAESVEAEEEIAVILEKVDETAAENVESIIMLAQRLEASLSNFKEIEA